MVCLAGVVCAFAGNTWTSDGTQLNESISAGSFSTSLSYVITFVGSTNFMAIGASANTVGVLFNATGAGSGTGTASPSVNNILAAANSGDTVNVAANTQGTAYTWGTTNVGTSIPAGITLAGGGNAWVALPTSAQFTGGNLVPLIHLTTGSVSRASIFPRASRTSRPSGQARHRSLENNGKQLEHDGRLYRHGLLDECDRGLLWGYRR